MNKDNLKHRVVGSIALVSFFVILIPIILQYKDRGLSEETSIQKDVTTDEVGLNENKNQSDPLFVAPLKEEKALTNSEYLLQELNEKLARSKPRDVQPSTNIPKSESWILQFGELTHVNKFYDNLILDGYFPRKISQKDIQSDQVLVRLGPYNSKQKANEILKEIEFVYQIKGILIKVVGATN